MSEDNLAAALSAFQAEMPTVIKSKTANTGSYSYTYADLAAVSEAIMPILSKHGLAFTCRPASTESGYELVGTLLHTNGSLSGSLPLNGRSPQELGSSITYMRRYLLGCLTGVVTDDDDDGQAAQRYAQRPKRSDPAPVDAPLTVPPRSVITGLLDEAADALGKSRAELTLKWRKTHDVANVKDLDDPDLVPDDALYRYVLSLQPYVDQARKAADQVPEPDTAEQTPDVTTILCDAIRPHPVVDKAHKGVTQACTREAGHEGEHSWW